MTKFELQDERDRLRLILGDLEREEEGQQGDLFRPSRSRLAAPQQGLAQIQAAKPASRYGMADGLIKPDAFVEAVYNSLRVRPRPLGKTAERGIHRH